MFRMIVKWSLMLWAQLVHFTSFFNYLCKCNLLLLHITKYVLSITNVLHSSGMIFTEFFEKKLFLIH